MAEPFRRSPPFSANENGAPLWGAVFVVGRIAGFEPTGPLAQCEASLRVREGELGPRLKAKHRFAAGDPHSPPSQKASHLLGRLFAML